MDGVVGTLLDVVEIDAGWEAAFEAAAGASVAAVVVSGSEPARQALSRLRQGGATGAVLALTGAVPEEEGETEAPAGTEPIRRHVRPRAGTSASPGSTSFSTRCSRVPSVPREDGRRPSIWLWPAPIWSSSPGTVTGSRPPDGGCGPVGRRSPPTWSTKRGPRAEMAALATSHAAEERTTARAAVEATRVAALEAVRSDDHNEVVHQTARATRQRVADDRAALSVELEELGLARVELEERLARDEGRADELRQQLPGFEEAKAQAADEAAAARQERRRLDERMTGAATARSEWEVRSAGLVERSRVLTERLEEVERRLTGHADERRLAAERRRRLEADATAVERLSAEVTQAQGQLDAALDQLRDRYRRQLEAVRAGGARLEELRRQRSAQEHELAAVRGRLQKSELDLVEATVRRESVIDNLQRELACGPEEAIEAPAPELAEGSDPMTRITELEAEVAALGPVNPLALEELAELSERHRFLDAQVEDVRSARRELHHVIRTLDEEIMHVFDAAFADVNEHFGALVTTLFPGGPGGSR